jgi:hypothetical protein
MQGSDAGAARVEGSRARLGEAEATRTRQQGLYGSEHAERLRQGHQRRRTLCCVRKVCMRRRPRAHNWEAPGRASFSELELRHTTPPWELTCLDRSHKTTSLLHLLTRFALYTPPREASCDVGYIYQCLRTWMRRTQ